jgi:molecular chaperone DnaK (HSP70)
MGLPRTPPHGNVFRTKLLLDASTKPAENDDPRLRSDIENHRLRLPSHRAADAQGVVADYLRELYAHLQTKVIKDLGREVFESTPMDVWLTVPATWSDQAQNSTKEAALEAGFGGRPGDTISIMFEPEAAAVAVLKQMTLPEALNKPSVCISTPAPELVECADPDVAW